MNKYFLPIGVGIISLIVSWQYTLLISGASYMISLLATFIAYQYFESTLTRKSEIIGIKEFGMLKTLTEIDRLATDFMSYGFEEDHDYFFFRLRSKGANYYYDRSNRILTSTGTNPKDIATTQRVRRFFELLEEKYKFKEQYLNSVRYYEEAGTTINHINMIVLRLWGYELLGLIFYTLVYEHSVSFWWEIPFVIIYFLMERI